MCRLRNDRCPLGDICGKNYKLLYRKNTEKECVDQLAWHIAKHPESHSWEDALAMAAGGVVESTRDHEVFVDENGDEVEDPADEELSCDDADVVGGAGGGGGGGGGNCNRGRKRKQNNKGGGGGGGGKGGKSKHHKGQAGNWLWKEGDGHHAKGWGVGDGWSAGGSSPSGVVQQASTIATIGAARTNSITLSGLELDEMIDNLNRAASAATHCASFCTKASKCFADEGAAMEQCKHMLERFRRLSPL